MTGDKQADLAGPGISTYPEVEKILPTDYKPLLNNQETQIALAAVKNYIEENLSKELNLFRVEVDNGDFPFVHRLTGIPRVHRDTTAIGKEGDAAMVTSD